MSYQCSCIPLKSQNGSVLVAYQLVIYNFTNCMNCVEVLYLLDTERKTDGWMSGRTNWRIGWLTNGWTGGCTDGLAGKEIHAYRFS